ncbi:antitoxin [Xenorhabdus eapokensis]|uniref:Antitoxin ParD n=1 Tax=Xenorhabdus eapokensis TaxID=1873482 RepID=A0A1Q5TKS4_9GAMM|nr:antitoxin [Xenorhabdus eapokensis]OKP00820.1 antitoxin [Xenorhabdus eapokensis]
MSRLSIDITERQHQNLKAAAALQGKTLRQYALERLFPGQDEDNEAWLELKTMLETRIHDGLDGKISQKSVNDILNEELSKEKRS